MTSAAEIRPSWPPSPMTKTHTTSIVAQANARMSMSRARSTRTAPLRVNCSMLDTTRTNMA
jgi:hypothetical protein